MLGNKTVRAQSAMEYLMTYGWAILIIAVVLGALFSLGVFNGGGVIGNACVASPGYLCQSASLGTTGNVLFTLGQNTGTTIYNIALACAATSTTTGYPGMVSGAGTYNAFVGVFTTGSTNGIAQGNFGSLVAWNGGAQLASGQTIAISGNGVPCYGTTGAPLGTAATPATIGQAFSGFIWMNYTTSTGGYSSTNPWYTVKIATVNLKVV